MQSEYFIAGDWGTTSCRLYLFEAAASDAISNDADNTSELNGFRVVETIQGLGVNKLRNIDIEDYFFKLTDQWLEQYQVQRVLLSGMVGSTIGWRLAGYASCPATVADQVNSSLAFEARGLSFTIHGGLKTENALGLPDTMRGEETQLVGASHMFDSGAASIVIMPGTHNKWAVVENGLIRDFFTAFTGELFSILNSHSVLTNRQPFDEVDASSFERGVIAARDIDVDIVHLLFSVRAFQLASDDAPERDAAYLLGLVIGRDIASALSILSQRYDLAEQRVHILGDGSIAETYKSALAMFGCDASLIDSERVVLNAYPQFYKSLTAS